MISSRMSTYPGMSLGGEIRESISLDEDDLSDVEDEVFIRDGKNGYKFVDDIGVKRPLMAPRRKLNKPDLRSRLKHRPPCKALCKPCCYIFGALTILIGLIVVVVIVMSMFPLPIDKIKTWLVNKTHKNNTIKLMPCTKLQVTDVWTLNLPKLTSESSIRTVDIDENGIDDIIFGFGTGDNTVLHQDIFCPMFMGVASPCAGGVIALNGTDGQMLWKKHLAHTIFTIFCSADLNLDRIFDCVATGKGGIFIALNSKDGSILWEFQDKFKDVTLLMDIYSANFINDIDNDGVSDVIASHTYQKDRIRNGHIILISGKTGNELQRIPTPNNAEIYYAPQLIPRKNGQNLVVFGTGSPNSPGNITVLTLSDLYSGNETFQTIYQDNFKGVLSPFILVDLTGDGELDIISAMFNSTVVAIDGNNFKQLWNISVNNSETLSVPTPGYFNDDNVTDFLIKYQTGPEFPIYYYSQTYIIDGKTGKFIYEKPIIDSVGSQMGGLTLRMEGHGSDFMMYWLADCLNNEGKTELYEFLPGISLKEQSNSDMCKLRFNSSKVTSLYALSQYDEPPGQEIYSSVNRVYLEFNNTKTPIEEATEYLKKHPEVQVASNLENSSPKVVKDKTVDVKSVKDASPFRHRNNNQGIVKDYNKPDKIKTTNPLREQNFETDYDPVQDTWQDKMPNYHQNNPIDDIDYMAYPDVDVSEPVYKKLQMEDVEGQGGRDPRGNSEDISNLSEQKILKKNLSDGKYGIFDYRNVKRSRNRILHDLNSSPIDILKDTFLKNREQQLRKSRFEQRDLRSHVDKMKENAEMEKVLIEEQKKLLNVSENLWNLETEKEMEEKQNGLWRGKRQTNITKISGIQRISSVGTLMKSSDRTKDTIDLVFLTYWTPSKSGAPILIEKDYECIRNKIKNALSSKEEILVYEKSNFKELFKKECLEERGALADPPVSNVPPNSFAYSDQISQLSLGQMTIYKVRIECMCHIRRKNQRCAKFLDPNIAGTWSAYMGKNGNGIFN